jgi:pimeloyl-ACP methyl ester carboxylesterase
MQPPAKGRAVESADRTIALPSGGALHVAGASGATPLLLLHGVGGGAWSWRPQRAELAATCRLFVWEARGHGAAARVGDAGLADYYVDAREALVLAVADAGTPVHVVGHSMGGLLAMSLACDDPVRVRSLFLIDPVYATESAGGHLPPSLAGVAAVVCAPLLRSIARNGTLGRAVMRSVFARAFENRERMLLAWADQRRQVPVEYPRMLRESFSGPTGFRVHDFAHEIGCPTYLLEGSARGGARFPALIAALRERLRADFVHDAIRGGHYLQLDRPSAVNGRIEAFVGAGGALATEPRPA